MKKIIVYNKKDNTWLAFNPPVSVNWLSIYPALGAVQNDTELRHLQYFTIVQSNRTVSFSVFHSFACSDHLASLYYYNLGISTKLKM